MGPRGEVVGKSTECCRLWGSLGSVSRWEQLNLCLVRVSRPLLHSNEKTWWHCPVDCHFHQ